MKTEVLLRSIGKINDELIADAESEANTKRKPGWAKLGTMAACLALVLCTGIATHAIRNNATAGTFTMDVNPSVEYTIAKSGACLLYTSPSPRDRSVSRMPSSA